jgi:hypothetical protein
MVKLTLRVIVTLLPVVYRHSVRLGAKPLKAHNQRFFSVGIATGYRLDDRGVGVQVPIRSRIFSSPCRPDRLWGPPNLLSMIIGGSFHGVKRPRREADQSPPTSAEVKKTWIYKSTPPYAFMA